MEYGNNVSDFSSGYSTSTFGSIDYTVDNIAVSNNFTTPFEFLNQVEIREMNFILYTKYAYYSIYDSVTEKTYHGIIDVKLNKVIFNTDEDIDVFIPYSSYSMLAITKELLMKYVLLKILVVIVLALALLEKLLKMLMGINVKKPVKLVNIL